MLVLKTPLIEWQLIAQNTISTANESIRKKDGLIKSAIFPIFQNLSLSELIEMSYFKCI